MINLIPLAGAGKRFEQAGYKLPKPLIPVSGRAMVIQASNTLPRADKWVYICRESHVKEHRLGEVLYAYAPNASVLTTPGLTDGQASTCLLAKHLINTAEPLVIGACDNGALWDEEKFAHLTKKADCILWTFRNNITVQNKPEQYGWVATDGGENAERVSVKVPLSATPVKDHAIVGTFWFREGRIFVEAAERMIGSNRRINSEFYVDECINDVIASGLRVKVFEVDKYICWGTPDDLRRFEYWESFFSRYDKGLSRKS